MRCKSDSDKSRAASPPEGDDDAVGGLEPILRTFLTSCFVPPIIDKASSTSSVLFSADGSADADGLPRPSVIARLLCAFFCKRKRIGWSESERSVAPLHSLKHDVQVHSLLQDASQLL